MELKKQIAFIGVGYDDKNDDDREIWSFIALTCDSLEPIR